MERAFTSDNEDDSIIAYKLMKIYPWQAVQITGVYAAQASNSNFESITPGLVTGYRPGKVYSLTVANRGINYSSSNGARVILTLEEEMIVKLVSVIGFVKAPVDLNFDVYVLEDSVYDVTQMSGEWSLPD